MEMSSFMGCKDVIKIVSFKGDVIKVKLELTENIQDLLDLLSKQNFIKIWYIDNSEAIYEI